MHVSLVAFLLVATATANDKYFVDTYDGSSNVFGSIPKANKSTDYVIFLGIVNSTNDCISTCISYGNINKTIGRCYSYSYFTDLYPSDNTFKRHCYGRFNDPLWSIIPQNGVNCGRIIWQCTSSMDCSLNGECNINGNCSCRIGWSGYRCNQLNLLPANKKSGYNRVSENINSWGGAVIVDHNNNDTKTKYHMILSQIVNHCTLPTWTINSEVIHAQSTNGWNSAYTFVDVMKLPFATEPDIVYGPNDEFVIYYEHYHYNWTCNCTESQSCKKPSVPCYQESMRYTKDITLAMNKWSDEIDIFAATNNSNTHDTNFAMVILKNGSVIGMSRKWNSHGSIMYLSLAENWLDNTTYTMFANNKVLFPQLTGHRTEDPYLYIDCYGGYHAIFHNMSPNTPNSTSDGYLGVVGGHSYSKDGINWIYAGASYGNVIQYEDGTTFIASSRERPHFIFDDNNCTPIALTNGVGDQNGYSWTLLQPIKH